MRLYFIHITAIIAVWLGTYFPYGDVLLAVIYLVIIGIEAQFLNSLKLNQKVFLAVLWQAPGIILASIATLSFLPAEYGYYAPFILQLWYTPLLPIAALIVKFNIMNTSFVYNFSLALPLFNIFFYIAAGYFPLLNKKYRSTLKAN